MKKLIAYIFGALFLAVSCGCSESQDDLGKMESGERKWNERASKELLSYMSLETMFPEQPVRALAKAAGKGKLAKVNELVDAGTDVNVRGTGGATPLFWAMRNYEGFNRLLELGADPNVVYGDGGTIIHRAVELDDSRFLRTVLKHGGDPNIVSGGAIAGVPLKWTPLFKAIHQDSEKINMLIEAGADLNVQDGFGNTPAMMAARRQRFEIVYILLESGADYSVKNDAGKSLLDWIAEERGKSIASREEADWFRKILEWLEARKITID